MKSVTACCATWRPSSCRTSARQTTCFVGEATSSWCSITCGQAEAERRGRQLQAAFDASPELADLPAGVGLSIGCVEVPFETRDVMSLVQAADERMYVDKKRAR